MIASWLSVGIDAFNNIPWQEVGQTIGTLAVVWGILKQTFPVQTQWVLLRIGGNKKVFQLMAEAAMLTTYTDQEKRKWVVGKLMELGMTANQADMVVALLYKKWQKTAVAKTLQAAK